jgi:hypothetical protein
MNASGWLPVTFPASTPEREPLARVDFHLTSAEREAAARHQARLVTHRNQPQKRRYA